MVYQFYILSRHFYLAKGDTTVDMTCNIETLSRGLHGTWYVGVKWNVAGKMKNGTLEIWTLTAMINYVAATLKVIKYNHLFFFHIFTSF